MGKRVDVGLKVFPTVGGDYEKKQPSKSSRPGRGNSTRGGRDQSVQNSVSISLPLSLFMNVSVVHRPVEEGPACLPVCDPWEVRYTFHSPTVPRFDVPNLTGTLFPSLSQGRSSLLYLPSSLLSFCPLFRIFCRY